MKHEVTELLNQQINREFYSGYLYLDFACFFEQCGLNGFAQWYRVQAQEELDHGMMFIRYLNDCGEEIHLQEIQQPVWSMSNGKTTAGILEASLRHEQYITHLIENIHAHAEAAHDLRTMHFLDWFIGEQAEEEKNAADLIAQFRLYGQDASVLCLLDRMLGKRQYAAPGCGD